MDSKGDGPQVIRPIPRRPFDLNVASPTPPEEESAPGTPLNGAGDHGHGARPGSAARLLDPRHEADSISRAASFVNLTASTLFGIYSPSTPGGGRSRVFDADADEPGTPWGTAGSLTPTQRPSLDDATFQVMKERARSGSYSRYGVSSPDPAAAAHATRRGSAGDPANANAAGPAVLSSLAARAALLFALGVGYGLLVTRLHSDRDLGLAASFGVEGLVPEGGYDWRYLVFWGVAGVALGGLLPWFDGVWEESFGKHEGAAHGARAGNGAGAGRRHGDGQETSPEMDWALVMRGIGAFVGIVFAIRKLPWTSTMQVSLTLALANPFLWYIIDRSKPGFWLSAAVGLAGSAVLMGLNPEMMPVPTGLGPGALSRNLTRHRHSDSPAPLGALASHETIETAIWMVSVLFCSCVFFGNIGRRLALSRSSTARGRWGGVR